MSHRSPPHLFVASLLLALSFPAAAAPTDWDAFVAAAAAEHGEPGRRCAAFLAEHHPPQDDTLSIDLLLENLRLALAARAEFSWCRELPEDLFHNDVLPYAVFDETRESWRPQLLPLGRELVAECKTSGEAAQAINRGLFQRLNVHYNTGRKQPNQSPSESIAEGRATCTGLSILLVDACRAVGVPARAAGTALWANKRGNHTWTEVWDGEWKFTGADEYDAEGLNRGWFAGDAANAIEDDWQSAIWATSWRKTGARFPMVWNLESHDVPGVNVTARYTSARAVAPAAQATVFLRAFAATGGPRIVVDVELLDGHGVRLATVTTRAGQADLNDMPSLTVEPLRDYLLRIRHGALEKSRPLRVAEPGAHTEELFWEDLPAGSAAQGMIARWLTLLPEERHLSIPQLNLSRADVAAVLDQLARARADELRATRADEHANQAITLGEHTLRFASRVFGEAGAHGHSLWISMHGGGGAPARVNEQQWRNQVGLYEPAEGIYVAPRAPTDTWNLWHEAHIDDLFDRLIENHVALEGVDPDRVYLMGYSAGGDGVYQLAPRFADRLAAAAMMAGHPNDASPLGLRNLPFMIFVGGQDAAYDRNRVAVQWGERLAGLQAGDADGYRHLLTVYPEKGHWMDREDRAALPWMAAHTRDAWPRSVVWCQSTRTHSRFYWLEVDPASARGGQVLRATVAGQVITLDASQAAGLDRVTLRLADELLDLDQPIQVRVGDATVFEGRVERSLAAIHRSLQQRADPRTVATALLDIELPRAE